MDSEEAELRDPERRRRVLAYFRDKFNDDRAKIMEKTGFTKGKIAQYYDETYPLGERAGQSLAKRLRLSDLRYFEKDVGVGAPPPPVNERFADPPKNTDQGVLEDLDALHPDDKKAWIEGLRTQANKARELVRQQLARFAKNEVKK